MFQWAQGFESERVVLDSFLAISACVNLDCCRTYMLHCSPLYLLREIINEGPHIILSSIDCEQHAVKLWSSSSVANWQIFPQKEKFLFRWLWSMCQSHHNTTHILYLSLRRQPTCTPSFVKPPFHQKCGINVQTYLSGQISPYIDFLPWSRFVVKEWA